MVNLASRLASEGLFLAVAAYSSVTGAWLVRSKNYAEGAAALAFAALVGACFLCAWREERALVRAMRDLPFRRLSR